MARRVVIAGGSGAVGRALARLLAPTWAVTALTTDAAQASGPLPAGEAGLRHWATDLFSVPETEIALAGADTVVFLARARARKARLVQASQADLDLLLADSVARAAPRVGARRLVFFACAPGDEREAVLRASGVPLAVLRGGGADPAVALAQLVDAADAGELELPPFDAKPEQRAAPPPRGVLSVQRYPVPAGWSARDVALAYVDWLDTAVSLVSVERVEGTAVIRSAGVPVLLLKEAKGRSDATSCWLDVADGLLVGGAANGHFEFRALADGRHVMAVLRDFEPSLPWPVYRVTQALAHAAVMKRFGRWLERQAPKPPPAG